MQVPRRRPAKRTCVVGLDGVPHSLIERFIKDETMPRLAEIVSQGCLGRMKVTLPEISMVSWTSFMTGTGPGRHGIYGFTDLAPDSYRLRFPSFLDVKVPTFWDELGDQGKRCVVINQPATYPARRINGVLVSGFVAIDLDKAVYPARYADQLRDLGYQLDIDTQEARRNPEYLFEKLDETLAERRQAVDLFWDKEHWDYFQIVITGTDRLFHYQWEAVGDKSNPNHGRVVDYFRNLDRFIGWLYERFKESCQRENPEEGFFMLSDHGFTGITQEVYLNAWLKENGYLNYAEGTPQSLEDLGEGSRAFALDPGRISINRRGRFPLGCVEADEVPSLKSELAAGLETLSYDGEAVVEAVHDAEEIYSGPESRGRPDLVVQSRHGFDLKASVKQRRVFARTDLQGMHTWDDAFFWSTRRQPSDLNIIHLREIITGSLGSRE